jgi:hypothetical protein
LFHFFEDLLCFACSPLESEYLDVFNKKIKICQNFAMQIWNASDENELNKKSTIFDSCGFYFENTPLENYLKLYGFINTKSDHINYILISKVFKTFEDFVNTIQIPYYSDYKIKIVKDNKNCYNLSNLILFNLRLLTIIIILFYI